MIQLIPRVLEADGLAPVLALYRAEAQAFLGQASTGLSDRRDQWHTPPLAIGAGGDLRMPIAEGGPTGCIEHRLAAPLLVQVPIPSGSTLHGA